MVTMKILVSGSTGLVGTALVSSLTGAGHQVIRLVRSQPGPGEKDIYWDPATGTLDSNRLEGFDAVVHLAGESIAEGRWTAEKKARIRNSRVKGTQLLAAALAQRVQRPGTLICSSAIGYYGDRGAEILREDSRPGSGFLPDVCREWEAATKAAADSGIRVVNLRTGLVLSSAGGALPKMLPPFKLGVGGKLGTGRQYMSWISIDDLVGAIQHAFEKDSLSGPVNAVSPHPVTNLEFTKTLGRVLSRPTIFPVPAFAVRLMFGQMGEDLLLASARVEPARLAGSGYVFRYPVLEGALRHVLRK
jgi:uncharacterized protein (TIGR01777 family)